MRARGAACAIAGLGVAGLLAGCASLNAAETSDATPAAGASHAASGRDPGCVKALQAISEHGPSAVKLMSEGKEAVTKATVQMLVDGLDGAADAAGSPQTKRAIQRLASDYVDFFRLSDDAVSIPLSTLLKDSTALEFTCH